MLRYAYPSNFWRRVFLPLIYLNVFVMLRWGQHGQVKTVNEIEAFLHSKEDLRIAIGSCRCRLGIPDVCDCPMKTDITISSGADVYKHTFPEDYEMISKEEAIATIKQLNSQGLIPIAYSFCLCGGARHEFVLCNCCIHACVPLLAQKIGGFHIIDPGERMPYTKAAQCKGCGTCMETCQLEARSIQNGKAHVNPVACLGCGACERNCPESAIVMVERPAKIRRKQVNRLKRFVNAPSPHHNA